MQTWRRYVAELYAQDAEGKDALIRFVLKSKELALCAPRSPGRDGPELGRAGAQTVSAYAVHSAVRRRAVGALAMARKRRKPKHRRSYVKKDLMMVKGLVSQVEKKHESMQYMSMGPRSRQG